MSQEWIFQTLSAYAYEPELIYLIVFGMMVASGFGLPIPEEVTIVSVGLLAYMGAHPEHFPPPLDAERPIGGYEAAVVVLICVVFADMLVFMIGRKFGRAIMNRPRWRDNFGKKVMDRINSLCNRFGVYAAFIFRFTPGIRFPAHIALGMSQLPSWKFVMMDGFAALISVPTQILLIYHYGEEILKVFKQFKIAILVIGTIAFFIWLGRYVWLRARKAPA